MKFPSITTALFASAAAAVLVAGASMPPLPVSAEATELAQAQGSRTQRQGDRHRPRGREGNQRQQPVDCHRDVRTHRINGEWVTHRHVGDDCQVRVVNRGTQPAPD